MLKSEFDFQDAFENITEIRYEQEEASSREVSSLLKKTTDYSNSSIGQIKLSALSTGQTSEASNNDMLALFLEYKLRKEKDRLDHLVEELTQELAYELKFFSVNDEDTSAERKIYDIQDKYSIRVLGEVVQNIYVRYNDYPVVLAGICKGLARFDLEEVEPWGPTMLSGLLMHKNELVKEYAVMLVENWADVKLLPILRNLDCASVWLRDYIADVIKYLEECDVLHKKII